MQRRRYSTGYTYTYHISRIGDFWKFNRSRVWFPARQGEGYATTEYDYISEGKISMYELYRNVIFLVSENESIAVVAFFLGQPEMIAPASGGWRLRVGDPDVISGCSGLKISGFASSYASVEHITGTVTL